MNIEVAQGDDRRKAVSELGVQTLKNMIWKSDWNMIRGIPKEKEIWGDNEDNRNYQRFRKMVATGWEEPKKLSSFSFERIGREMMLGRAKVKVLLNLVNSPMC